MALIGTISGSVGTGGSLVSSTAISGTLIIADAPPSSFPTLASGVKLFVSGAKSAIGADAPAAIFGGDTFISGAFGTDSYIQMKPVNTLRVPTNTTASYIYTSGSTNDMYFTQYAGPYTNTTRLRWLESVVGTGLLTGGVLSTAPGSTTFSMTAGEGLVVTQNASTSEAPYPTIYHAVWNSVVSRSLDYISTAQITYIGIDGSSQIVQRTTPISLTEDSAIIPVGRILHTTGSVTSAAVMNPTVSYGAFQYLNDFARAIGPLKVTGHVLAASGSTLGITRSAGSSFVLGKNYTLDPNNPNIIPASSDPATVTSKVWRQYINSSGNLVIDSGVGGAGYVGIDPNNYVNAGVLTAVPPNKYTIQRAFWFPNSVTNAVNVCYGSTIYNSLSAAVSAVSTESFTEGANTQDAAIFLGYICVKAGTTDLSNTSDAAFIQSGIFRNVSGGGGGGGSTVPGDGDTSVQFNDGGFFNGTQDFRFLKSTATAIVGNMVVTGTNTSMVSSGSIQVKDVTGNVVVNLTNTGNVTGSNLLLTSGFVVTGSGIIESNTSTSALRVTQQGTGNAILVEDSVNPDSTPFVVAADGKVGIGTLASSANLFVSGTDPNIPAFVAKGADVTVNTLTVTGSAGASTAVGFVNIDQGNYSNKYGLMITNIGAGTAGLKLRANTTGGSFAIDNMNTTPQITMTHKNLWFRSDSTAADTSQVTYKFIENNKVATYPNQKTFLISGEITGPTTGSYFEVEKSGSAGSIKLLELQGDTTDNALYVSGAILATGSIFTAGDLAVNGGDITTTSTTFNLITGSATTVNFAQTANSLNIGKLTGNVVISSTITGSSPALFGDTVTIGGPSQSTLNSSQTTANIFNTTATTVNMGGAATTINLGSSLGRTFMNGNASISGSLTVTGSVAVNGGNITSTAASFNIANTTPTTVTIGDNAANLYLGKSGTNRVFIQGNLLLNNNEIQASGGGTALTFPAGNTSALFAANVTVTGDVAVNGGDLTTTSTSFNLLNGTATSIAFGGAAASMKIASGSGTNVEIGSSSGRTTIYNDLVLGTGNILVTNDATPMSLISSGNVVAKLDVNNNGTGHRFDIQDWRGISQFFVGEDGNAELSGSLVVSGTTNIGTTVERLLTTVSSTGTVTFDTTFSSIFYVNGPAGDITANFTNVPTTSNNRVITPTVILSQSATPRVINAVQVNSAATPILWANKLTPVGTANQQDVYGFSLIRSGSIWTVLGQMSTYG